MSQAPGRENAPWGAEILVPFHLGELLGIDFSHKYKDPYSLV